MQEEDKVVQVWFLKEKDLYYAFILADYGQNQKLTRMKLGSEDRLWPAKETERGKCKINSNELINFDDCLEIVFDHKKKETDCYYFINFLLVSKRLKNFVEEKISRLGLSTKIIEKAQERAEKDYGFKYLGDFLRRYPQKVKK